MHSIKYNNNNNIPIGYYYSFYNECCRHIIITYLLFVCFTFYKQLRNLCTRLVQ